MAEPKCPSCGIAGIQHFASKASEEKAKNKTPWFYVVYCDACGHVHQIINKHQFSAGQSPLVMPDIKL